MTEDKLQQLKRIIDIMHKLVAMNITYLVFDETCAVRYIAPKDGQKDGQWAEDIVQDLSGKLSEVLRSGICNPYFLTKNGEEAAVEGNIVPVYENEKICGAILSVYPSGGQSDAADRKIAAVLKENQELIEQLKSNNDTLFQQSMVDELTKLYNRKGLGHMGKQLLRTAKEKGWDIFTFVADLNGLKYINDTCGHREGDKAIQVIAGQLCAAAPEAAIVARTGGDEFIIMAGLEAGSGVSQEIERRFVESMKQFNQESNLPYRISASFGWECRNAKGMENLDECISTADRRMYEMKTKRRAPGRYPQTVQNEMFRRFGSAKHMIILLSDNPLIQQEIETMFDENYRIFAVPSWEEAKRLLEEKREMVLAFIDGSQDDSYGLKLLEQLPKELQKNTIRVLLLEQEKTEIVKRAFELGADDVLVKPYATELHKRHMDKLFRINVANWNLSYLLETSL